MTLLRLAAHSLSRDEMNQQNGETMSPTDPALEASRRSNGGVEAAARTLHDRCCPYSHDEDDWLNHGEVGRQRWHDAVAEVQLNARAAALDEAVDEFELPGSNATGYYASNNVAGYQEAERHAQVWLSSRAQRIRDER